MAAILALAPLFVGPLAPYGEVLRLPEAGQTAIPVRELMQSDGINAVLAEFRPKAAQEDQRALLSLWSQYYFLRLLPPVLAVNLFMGRDLPLAVDDVQVVIQQGQPVAFVLQNEGEALAPETPLAQRFSGLMEGHLVPVVQAWAKQVNLAGRVYWGNVGSYLDWIVRELKTHGVDAHVWRPLVDYLALEHLTTGRRNPLYRLYRQCQTPSDDPLRVRRHCCIRYRLPDTEFCPDCPRLCKSERRRASAVA